MKLFSKTVSFVFILLLITALVPAQADDHYAWLPADTPFVITIHNAQEIRDFWNYPEIQQMLSLGGEEFMREFPLKKINAALQLTTNSTLEELFNDLDGALTFAIKDVNFDTKDIEPAVFLDFSPGSDRISTIVKKLKAAAELEDPEAGPEITHRVIGTSDVFTFQGRMSITRVENTLVFFRYEDESDMFAMPEQSLVSNDEFNEHAQLVNMGNGISVYVNIGFFVNKLAAWQENNPEDMGAGIAASIMAMLDLYSVKSASATMPLRDEDEWRLFIKAPGYDGIFTDVFTNEPITESYLSSISSQYDGAFGISVRNGKEIFERVLDRMSKHLPMVNKEEVYANMEEAKTEAGIDFIDGLLANIGGHFGLTITYKDEYENISANNPMAIFDAINYQLQLGVVDSAKLSETLETMVTNEEMDLRMKSWDYNGATIWGFDPEQQTPPVGFSMAIAQNRLYIAMHGVNQMKATIDSLSGPSLAQSDGVAPAIAAIPADSMAASVAVADYFADYARFSKHMTVHGEELPEEYLAQINKIIETMQAEGRPSFGYYQVRNDGFFGVSDFSLRSFMRMMLIEAIKAKAMFEQVESMEAVPEEPKEEQEEQNN